jgi:preprotein translocase subunit SecG
MVTLLLLMLIILLLLHLVTLLLLHPALDGDNSAPNSGDSVVPGGNKI